MRKIIIENEFVIQYISDKQFTPTVKESTSMVNKSAQCTEMRVDDYLDLLNLAKQLNDLKWQKEIIRKLERLNDRQQALALY